MGAIGFFAPLPIALMIPFMGAQSAVMGEAFGKHFQYGKRKISAMSNEEFNKLTSADLFDDTLHGFSQMIPKLEQSMRRTEGLQSFVIEQLIRYVRSIPDDIISGLQSGPISDSPLIQNLEGNIAGGLDVANSIASFFQNLNKSFGIDTTGAGKGHRASASSAPIVVKTPDTSTQIKLQNEIDRLKQEASTTTSPNPNVSKIVEKNNIRTTYNNKGQIVSQEVIDKNKIPASQTAQSTSAQTIVKTFTAPKLPRAPNSICIQIRKIQEVYNHYQERVMFWFTRPGGPVTSNVENFKTLRNREAQKIAALKRKYDTSGCKK